MKKSIWFYGAAFAVAAGAGAAIFALFADISEKKAEARQYPLLLSELSDEKPHFDEWGKNFPQQLSDWRAMEHNTTEATEFGGSLPYSKIIRYPQIATLWAGYAFAVDFNEERSHWYNQIDQVETMRNNKEYLNAHGLPAFKGQPGACVNCHTGWLTWLNNTIGWEEVNARPYFDVMAVIKEKHGTGIHGSEMGGTCADCHSPKDMSLRVTRPAYINAMVDRGYEADPEHGLKGTRQEMRGHVCQQCHVEYYFKGKGNTLTFPWHFWAKGERFRIENLDEHYDDVRDSDIFLQDWKHRDTKAPMLKVQHPETELYSSSVHAQNGVTCVDCHMPYKRAGANKITSHNIRSPLFDINASCKTCHAQSEEYLASQVRTIQRKTASELRVAENALIAMIADVKAAREEMAKLPQYADITDEAERESAISKALADVLELHRKAQMRWDFVFSENSTGFHSPQEAARVLQQSTDMARSAQLALQNVLAAHELKLPATVKATMPEAPARIELHHSPVADAPPARLVEVDKAVSEGMF